LIALSGRNHRVRAKRLILEIGEINAQVIGFDIFGAQVAPANPRLSPRGYQAFVVINENLPGVVLGIGLRLSRPPASLSSMGFLLAKK
jgi:hypothetical protein